jgi:DNA-binding beta-propeller fold protein YncE
MFTTLYSGGDEREVSGLAVSADGKTLYVANSFSGNVLGFDINTKAQVFNSGFIAGTPDGMAVGTGVLEGLIFVNNNNGTVLEINPLTNKRTLIATGGSRGDFVQVDPNNHTLLLTQTDSILRLTAPSGSGFGPSPAPEPSTLCLLGLGTLVLLPCGWRRRKQVVA